MEKHLGGRSLTHLCVQLVGNCSSRKWHKVGRRTAFPKLLNFLRVVFSIIMHESIYMHYALFSTIDDEKKQTNCSLHSTQIYFLLIKKRRGDICWAYQVDVNFVKVVRNITVLNCTKEYYNERKNLAWMSQVNRAHQSEGHSEVMVARRPVSSPTSSLCNT